MQIKKQQLEPDMEQWTGSKLGKEYKVVYCHSACINILQSISCEILGWKHAAQARINNLRYSDDFSQIMAEHEEKVKNLLTDEH